MRICVLGHRGMLGNIVTSYFSSKGCQVITINHRFSPDFPEPFLEEVQATKPDWCINCIGLSPKQAESGEQLFKINSFLPKLLVTTLPSRVEIVQPSSDGVFSPLIPKRHVTDIPDAVDDYGLSKRQAERVIIESNCYVIRCSIIGIEIGTTRSLLSWFFSQTDSVAGYTNHYWNGITTLEWAKLCYKVINNKVNSNLIVQPGFEPAITKFELLTLAQKIWGYYIRIENERLYFL
jgi:dTDP-4-dehydrorhamnose reductase